MKKIFLITILFLLVVSFSGCLSNNSESSEWTGFYYPDKNDIGNEKTWVIQPGLNSLQNCQNWVADIADVRNSPNYDYECGYKCKYDFMLGTYVCKTTEK